MIWRYLPPNGGRYRRAGHTGQLITNGELTEIAQLGFVQALRLSA